MEGSIVFYTYGSTLELYLSLIHISLVRKVGFTTQGNTHVFCLLFERR